MQNFSFDFTLSSSSGGGASTVGINPKGGWGSLAGMNSPGTVYYASSSVGPPPPTAGSFGTLVTFNDATTVYLTLRTISGSPGTVESIRYSLNGGSFTTYSTPISVSATNTLKIAVLTRSFVPIGATLEDGELLVRDGSLRIIDSIPYSIILEG